MSAPSTIVAFGIRITFDDDFEGMEELELRRHPWMKRATGAGLRHWWSRIDEECPESHALFIGDIVAHVGPEHAPQESTPPDELFSRCRAAGAKLAQAGFVDEFGPPALWTQWVPDF